VVLCALWLGSGICRAQDLAPRAYTITPLRSNAITLTWSFNHGDILFEGATPITDASGTYQVPVFSYYHSFSFFGRSANVVASVPYAVGSFQGTVLGEAYEIHRSGLADSAFRFSFNLKGGPAMSLREMVKWQQHVLLGASLKVVAPTGQYDSTRLINWGANRWGFKPEFGYSQRWNHWVLDGYVGAWFYTTNSAFFSNNAFYGSTRTQSQDPIGVFEGHLSYDVRPLVWVSLDGNFWFGGSTSLNGVKNANSYERDSRIGGTGAFRVSVHQSLKLSYSDAGYVRFGGRYKNVSVAWQYTWLGEPK